MYELIKQLVKQENDTFFNNHKKFIETAEDDRLKSYSTPTRWTQYMDGKITRDELIGYAIKRQVRKYEKRAKEDCAKLERFENLDEKIISIQIHVEWRYSTVWGLNPTAYAVVKTNKHVFTGTGKASGCGYDKESAAIASALNDIDVIGKMLCDYKQRCLETGAELEYGCGGTYSAMPFFEGGVGVSCFIRTLKECELDLISYYNTTIKHAHYTFFAKGE